MAIVSVAPNRSLRISVNGSERTYAGSRTMRTAASGGAPVETVADVIELPDRLASQYVSDGTINPVQSVTVANGQTLSLPTSNGQSIFPAGTTLFVSSDIAAAARAAGTIN